MVVIGIVTHGSQFGYSISSVFLFLTLSLIFVFYLYLPNKLSFLYSLEYSYYLVDPKLLYSKTARISTILIHRGCIILINSMNYKD